MGCQKFIYKPELHIYSSKKMKRRNGIYIYIYRYGYQGSEQDNDLSGAGNSYTTFYRELDPRLGRWMSYDPKPRAWESPFASMGNNPICNNDILGDEFDPKSDKHIKKIETKINTRKEEVNKDINNKENDLKALQDKLSTASETEKKGINSKIEEISTGLVNDRAILKELSDATKEIEEMKKSPQLFRIRESHRGETFAKKDGSIQMNYMFDNMKALSHELKHGHQYLKGEMSFYEKGKKKGILYDINDEVAAYKRGYALEPTSNPMSIITADKVRALKDIDGKETYKNLPSDERNIRTYEGPCSPKEIFFNR